MKKIYQKMFLLLALVLPMHVSWAQSTTASLNGLVSDESGSPLPGATIIALHNPTNTQYVATTNTDGRYNIQNMRVGGPYTVKTSYVGFQEQSRQNIFLSLGQSVKLDFAISSGTIGLGEVEISTRRDNVINPDRTGAATNISREQLERLPTLSRGLSDFTRLTPQASSTSGGTSVGGSNNRYNNITIDGAVNNDVFGLAGSGTPGGQAGTQPISLDAIEQIQVVVAPYDVKMGNFTGGGINAVTRSGSNNFEGSAFGFLRNENTVGKSVDATRTKAADFKDYQAGFRIGGPILKDKLFFFLNGEVTRRSEPLQNNLGSSTSIVPADSVQLVYDFLKNNYGYDAGSFGNIDRLTESNKVFARLDWNINAKHQLTLRHNFVDAFDDNITRFSNNFRFGNNAYKFNSKTNSTVAELRSNFSATYSNNLIVGYSRIRDSRETLGGLFPQVQINYSNGGNGNVVAGTERSSAANELDQDIIEFTDNLTIFKGKHTFTVGTHNEFFSFRNLFINNSNGYYQFSSFKNFFAAKPFRAEATYSAIPGNDRPSAEFDAMQLGAYIQDEYNATDRLRLTLGLRLDVPVLPDQPDRNEKVEDAFDSYPQYTNLRTDATPSGELLFAPRAGFNWDVRGNKTFQVRGGTGIFTGRVPFVWLSNQFTNNGITFNTIFNSSNPRFEPNPALQSTIGTAGTTSEINLVREDFKIPQTFRSNLAADYELPMGIIATVEGIYSKTLNDVVYKDINLKDPVGTLPGPDNRPVYATSSNDRKISRDFTNVILLDNAKKGYTYTVTGQLQKTFTNGINTMMAYTYGESKDLNSGASSTARSNWQFNQIVNNPNDPELSYSRFDIRHRIIASGGYTVKYGNNFGTSVSVFYQGQSGTPFTYLYRNDLNNDGNNANDLLYIPRNRDEIILIGNSTVSAEQMWNDLNDFIENDDYLKERRGQYSERNGARMPWTNQLDLRLGQDFYINANGKKHTLQLTFDVFNLGNLLNKDWGRNYTVANAAYELVTYAGRQAVTGLPTFTFSKPKTSVWDENTFGSRWQGQFGLRYIFN
ncbi:TonB-dependent receptor [Adhaeribacter terreus]|uniref:Carboxypeptidase regulatory-like domain-containing protein n=1 Tax=Adhaeribacter terreus TaxID=529703 RepID=A0ABW0E6U4_9BACT